MDKWIDMPGGKRHVAIHKDVENLYIMGARDSFTKGRPLTEIEHAMSDEIFRLRAIIDKAKEALA